MERNTEFLESLETKSRFSNRVENYVKYRPHYPLTLLEFMEKEKILRKRDDFIVADIGAGTGLFSELLLEAGYHVIAVEPNKPMRDACSQTYGHLTNLTVVDGSSEQSNLEDKSIDLITTAQAFHWFKIEETKKEWTRILKKGGRVVLIWNSRKKGEDGTPFLREYEAFITKFATQYKKMQENFHVDEKIQILFEKNGYKEFHTDYTQILNFEEFKGRVLSSSYMPQSDHKIYPEMMIALKELFVKHQVENQVSIDYDTELYYGKIH